MMEIVTGSMSTHMSVGEAAEAVDEGPEAEGERVVDAIVTTWTAKYHYDIQRLGPDQEISEENGPWQYQVVFSLPVSQAPVPMDVLRVVFRFLRPVDSDAVMTYGFESSDLVHHWVLERDENGRWKPVPGQQETSLGHASFEAFLDARLIEKDHLRNALDMRTPFEQSRLVPPPAYSDAEFDEDVSTEVSEGYDEDAEAELRASRAGPHDEEISLAHLLANVFDAADEACCGFLSHHEVAELLASALLGMGLELWDIHLLMTATQEDEEGFIEYKDFVQAAPEIIQSLKMRRSAYKERGMPKLTVSLEAIQMCHGDEIAETTRVLADIFETYADQPVSQDPEQVRLMNRSSFYKCLMSRQDRLSPQETQRLMQMMPEDEDGCIPFGDFQDQLENLRAESLHNALVETDVESLRKHLILLLRHHGLQQDCMMPLWNMKKVLLRADQLCLTRLQIHVLLCMCVPNYQGLVDAKDFLEICCTVIPHMFDADHVASFAEALANASADAIRKAELAELEAMTKGLAAANKAKEEDDGKAEEVIEVDRETVEKTLMQVFSALDETRRGLLSAETMFKLLTSTDVLVQSCQLSDVEIRGFAAELSLDENGEVAYREHVQTWVPIVFELRKNQLYEVYFQKDPFGQTPDLVIRDLSEFQQNFPLLPPEMLVIGGENRQSSTSRRVSLRHFSREGGSKDDDEDRMVRRATKLRHSVAQSPIRDAGAGLHSLKLSTGSRQPSFVKRSSTLEVYRPKRSVSGDPNAGTSPLGRGSRRRQIRGIEPVPEVSRKSGARNSLGGKTVG